jgi:hypothetical protein
MSTVDPNRLVCTIYDRLLEQKASPKPETSTGEHSGRGTSPRLSPPPEALDSTKLRHLTVVTAGAVASATSSGQSLWSKDERLNIIKTLKALKEGNQHKRKGLIKKLIGEEDKLAPADQQQTAEANTIQRSPPRWKKPESVPESEADPTQLPPNLLISSIFDRLTEKARAHLGLPSATVLGATATMASLRSKAEREQSKHAELSGHALERTDLRRYVYEQRKLVKELTRQVESVEQARRDRVKFRHAEAMAIVEPRNPQGVRSVELRTEFSKAFVNELDKKKDHGRGETKSSDANSTTGSEEKKVFSGDVSRRLYNPDRLRPFVPLPTTAELCARAKAKAKVNDREREHQLKFTAEAAHRLCDVALEKKKRTMRYLESKELGAVLQSRGQSAAGPQTVNPKKLGKRLHDDSIAKAKAERMRLERKYLSNKRPASAPPVNSEFFNGLYKRAEVEAAHMRTLVHQYTDDDRPSCAKYLPEVSDEELDLRFQRLAKKRESA